jgi:fatty acid desaturase
MKYSQLPRRYRFTALAAFFSIIGAWAWLVHAAVYDWLPQSIINYIALAMFAFAGGFFLGEKSATREIERHRYEGRTAADLE